MLTVTASSASELFAAACRAVLASGKPGAPRGLSTVEARRDPQRFPAAPATSTYLDQLQTVAKASELARYRPQ